jgi:hypothetical protein
MGRANSHKHTGAYAYAGERTDDSFCAVFGNKRGSNRVHAPLAAKRQRLTQLSYRVVDVSARTRERVYDPLDALVRVCEQCGNEDFLLRDYDSEELSALCLACLSTLGSSNTECEDWCALDLDHSGLCTP